MRSPFVSSAVLLILLSVSPFAARAQDGATQAQIERRDPDFCGAGGAGCDPADVQKWKAIGNNLADLSSADLSQYAYACTKNREWKSECETNPIAILKRLGIEGY